jgi:hypothetical protein
LYVRGKHVPTSRVSEIEVHRLPSSGIDATVASTF